MMYFKLVIYFKNMGFFLVIFYNESLSISIAKNLRFSLKM